MSLEFSLREHKHGAYDPAITFTKPSASVVRINTTNDSVGHGYIFIVVPRTWLNGKYLRFHWQGQGNYEDERVFKVLIYDGAYDRTSDTDFPSGSELPSKGAGLLQTVSNPAGTFTWTTNDVLIDVSGGTEDKCTIFFALADLWTMNNFTLGLDWVEFNTGSGGSGMLYDEQFTDSVHMEVTGTYGDYGYISSGETAPPVAGRSYGYIIG